MRRLCLISLLLPLVLFSALSFYSQEMAETPVNGIRQIYAGFEGSPPYTIVSGCQGNIPLWMRSLGDERLVSFTINWDPRVFSILEAKDGTNLPPGATVSFDRSQIALGRLGISISSSTAFAAGTLNLINLTSVSTGGFGTNPVTFSSVLTPQRTIAVNGEDIATIFLNGVVIVGSCDPGTFMGIGTRQTQGGRAVLPISISEFFSLFSGETSFRFSVSFDRTKFIFQGAALGTGARPGTTLEVDGSQIDEGRVGLIINGTNPLPPASQGANLVNLTFDELPGIANGSYPVFFSNSPVPIATLDINGTPRFGSGLVPGALNKGTTTTLSGTVLTSNGSPLRNATVSLRGTPLTATTGSFGTFTFPNLPHSNNFVIVVNSKRYRFAAVPVAVRGPTNVELRGLE